MKRALFFFVMLATAHSCLADASAPAAVTPPSAASDAQDASLPLLAPRLALNTPPDQLSLAAGPDVAAASTTSGPPPAPSAALPENPPVPPVPDPAPAATSAPASSNVTINLLQLLVARGVLSKSDAAGLMQQAQQEAAQARAAAAPKPPPTPVDDNPNDGILSAPSTATDDDTVNVAYVPQVVKNQIRDEVEADVLKDGHEAQVAAVPNAPADAPRFHISGDLRVRYEDNIFPSGNDDTGAFPNFDAINTGAPFNTAGANFPPSNDVDADRERFRLRARLGTVIDLPPNFSVGLRAATGSDDSPVTENQTLGGANNGQGGDFGKYQLWLDRAYIKYELGGTLDKDFTVEVGRFDNPFFSTSIIWADDIGFDGVMARGRYAVAKGVVPFLTMGGFPVFNTDFNFATNQPAKFHSEDKYLYAIQGGVNWDINEDIHVIGAAAYYYFDNISGKLSDPFTPLSSADQGDTDDTRPSFAQNGNTYFPIRDIVPNASNDFGTINQFQYYGLASQFKEVALTGQIDYSRFDPLHLSLVAEAVKNVGFDKNAVSAVAVNNLGSGGNFDGGDTAYNVVATVGHPDLQALWDWNIRAGYRYVESDAVVDGFTDADFGGPLTGTNLEGYTLEGNLGLNKYVFLRLKYYAANAIAGAPYRNDLLQFDINAKF
jgi:hypothetical protein